MRFEVPVQGDYGVQDDFGAFDEGIAPPQDLISLSEQALGHVPYPWLYARVDALVMDDGTWVLNELEMIEPSLFFSPCSSCSKDVSMLCASCWLV